MKLLTKAWYQTMQDSALGVQLRADERAAVFSEDLFQRLRQEKLTEWLEFRREFCADFGEAFDEAAERSAFEGSYQRELEIFQTRTPAKILRKVADLRVLALGCCAEEVFEDLREYRQWCRKWTEKTMEEARNMRISQGLDKAWTGEHSLHDAVVLSENREGEDLVLKFEYDEEAAWPEIRGVRFLGSKILKQERPVEKAFWLYDEIWRTEEGDYEIHALLWKDHDVFDLTIQCRETELLWTVPPRTE